MKETRFPSLRIYSRRAYVEVFRLSDAVRRRSEIWTRNRWIILHDDASEHQFLVVRKCLEEHNLTALEHPPYFQDLSTDRLFPVSAFEKCSERITVRERRALTKVWSSDFQECFEKLYERWKKCAAAQGNCFEGYVL
jgi:hypothetical protein